MVIVDDARVAAEVESLVLRRGGQVLSLEVPSTPGPRSALDGSVPAEEAHAVPSVPELSRREAEVVSLIATGMTNEQIAERLYLSVNSVKTYVRTAYRKMGVQRRSQAMLWALGRGIVAEPADDRASRGAAREPQHRPARGSGHGSGHSSGHGPAGGTGRPA